MGFQQVTVWVHDEAFSKDEVLVAPDVFGENKLPPDALIEIVELKSLNNPHDSRHELQATPGEPGSESLYNSSKHDVHTGNQSISVPVHNGTLAPDPRTLYHFIARPMPAEIQARHPTLQISVTSTIANSFGYRQRAQAAISLADRRQCSASHVEIIFRDQYLSRSDMWRLVHSELAGKTVYKGKKYSSSKWVEVEARHLVSIVLFSRLEYERHAFDALQQLDSDESEARPIRTEEKTFHRDFYRVVVTDMASGQWTVILNELKKDFRVFLRDITLHQPQQPKPTHEQTEARADEHNRTRICGRPASAPRGNILEAINIASTQFANDHLDRDLVRTGMSVIVITPGTGVFEVDSRLLDLTSENLTNDGISIDLVCLSKMPLHSVPLFKWRRNPQTSNGPGSNTSLPIVSPNLRPVEGGSFAQSGGPSPSHGAILQQPPRTKVAMNRDHKHWSFGIPHWIHISYWSWSGQQGEGNVHRGRRSTRQSYLSSVSSREFVPRVRMYELQMMGAMELGLANISIPYLSEGQQEEGKRHKTKREILEHHKTRASLLAQRAALSRPTASPRSNSSVHAVARGHGLLSVQARSQGDMLERMETYDENLFNLSPKPAAAKFRRPTRKGATFGQSSAQSSRKRIFRSVEGKDGSLISSDTDNSGSTSRPNGRSDEISNLHSVHVERIARPTDSRISRSMSFALRGLGPSAPRAIASTEINVENAQAENSVSNVTSHYALGDSSGPRKFRIQNTPNTPRAVPIESELRLRSDSSPHIQATAMSPSKPISIKKMTKRNLQGESGSQEGIASSMKDIDPITETQRDSPTQSIAARTSSPGDNLSEPASRIEVASNLLTPEKIRWIESVNPANPRRNRLKGPNRTGRWQHLYPCTPKSSMIEWKALCIPASLPLTTEQVPSDDELENQYDQTGYVISPREDSDSVEVPRTREWLLREMIGLRLSHGYQFVVGDRVAHRCGAGAVASLEYSTPEKDGQDGVTVFMSMGDTIQKLVCANGTDVQVTRYVHKNPKATEGSIESISYSPVIRTILSTSYSVRNMTLGEFPKGYAWNLADCHLSGQKDDLRKVYEKLRFWRARFVVIPVEPPASARWPAQSMSEDNDEEIHLLGIRELTKMWQRMRYIPSEERRFKPAAGKRKDANPLEISFQTLDSSEVVATEIEKLLAADEGAETGQIQLLPDSELLERSTSSLSKIAQVLQGEKGVEIANRRWHLRLHSSCFKGDDFTNWLISSFKDIDSREEAVDFGNELMNHGLFHHVSTRHTFKDGNYFYTIAPEHRTFRPESRSSWFPGGRRSDRSVPATPVIEGSGLVSPVSNHPHMGFGSTRQIESRVSEKSNGEKRQVSVSLTKMMRIEVDHRSPKRSDRVEIVNLHYDRLHNPENCYHFELAWLNVTSKLVEDAIVNWATQSEKYGLRLVEVPIAEACSISDREPFREPYRIALKEPPPPPGSVLVNNASTCFTNTSFAQQSAPSPDKLVYQKALLKHFNFVLDLEAAWEFPSDVEVTHTWGKVGYRYPQFVHRSGVILAQITDEGELLLLANRLYNTRSALAKDTAGRFEMINSRHRPIPTTGIVGVNLQGASPHPSPLIRATSDAVGGRDASTGLGMPVFVTPEQIKDELQDFCRDADKLKAFYKEISERGASIARKSGSSSSTALRPLPELGLESSIPDLRLPASVITAATATAKSLGVTRTKKDSPQQAAREKRTP